MPDRKRLVFTLGLTSSLALLALVLIVSVRSSELAAVSSRPDSLRNDFTLPAGQPTTCLGAAMATDAMRKIKALPPKDEEEEGADALVEPRGSFLSFCSVRKSPERQSIIPPSILSLYPLRC